MSEHKKTITAISWCPHNPEVFASASADNLLIIWNVAEQKAVARLDNTKGTAVIRYGNCALCVWWWGWIGVGFVFMLMRSALSVMNRNIRFSHK